MQFLCFIFFVRCWCCGRAWSVSGGGRAAGGQGLSLQPTASADRLPPCPVCWRGLSDPRCSPLPPAVSGRGSLPFCLLLCLHQPSRPAGRTLSPFLLPFPHQTTTAGTTATRRAAATPAPATSSSATAGAASPCTGPVMGTTTAETTATRLTPTAPTRVSPRPRQGRAVPVLLLGVSPLGSCPGREQASGRWTLPSISSAAILTKEPRSPLGRAPPSRQEILQPTLPALGAQIPPPAPLGAPRLSAASPSCPLGSPSPSSWGQGSEWVPVPSHQPRARPGAATPTSSSAGWTGSASPCAGAAMATQTAWTPVTRRTARGSPMSATPTSSLAARTQVRAGEGGNHCPWPPQTWGRVWDLPQLGGDGDSGGGTPALGQQGP